MCVVIVSIESEIYVPPRGLMMHFRVNEKTQQKSSDASLVGAEKTPGS